MIDHGAPYVSLAQAEFEFAAKQWQQTAAHAAAEAARYVALAHELAATYRHLINLEK